MIQKCQECKRKLDTKNDKTTKRAWYQGKVICQLCYDNIKMNDGTKRCVGAHWKRWLEHQKRNIIVLK